MSKELTETEKLNQPTGFDLRTHAIDSKTGKVKEENHYKLTISKDKGSIFERPIGSKKFFYLNGEAVKGSEQRIEATQTKQEQTQTQNGAQASK